MHGFHARVRAVAAGWLAALCLSLTGCGRGSESAADPEYAPPPVGHSRDYVFAVHPLHNPVRLQSMYGPLVDYLNRRCPEARFRLEASRDYEDFERKLLAREVEFAVPNPYQTLLALRHGYHVIAKMGDDHKFTGLLLVRRDGGIREVADLKGRKVAYPARSALAATMLPQYFLQTHGLDVDRDIENLYVGSQESSIMNVYLGKVAAAATWPLPWLEFQQEQPARAAELEVKWETGALINNGVVVRDDVPAALAAKVAGLLDGLHTTEDGRRLLERLQLSRFELADDNRYRPIEEFLAEYQQTVGPLPAPLP